MILYKNETVAQAETIILITAIAEQMAALDAALTPQMRRHIKQFADNIHSHLGALGESIQKFSQPDICGRCRHTLTESQDQFEAHLQAAADRMLQLTASWPREEFVGRMRRELRAGDEIIFIAIGSVTVLRSDGSHRVIYRLKK